MKPRELSREESIDLLSKARYGRLGLCIEGRPYVIPMSFVYSLDKIFLHSRNSGRKVEAARKNPSVCFEVDHLIENKWRSVIVAGVAVLSTSMEAKARMFEAFTARGIGGHGGAAFSKEMLERMEMCVWEISPIEISGREGIW
jgi:nitroimidazol reductase NimA-like FMN-containing flavoprotein (pyridoxamine 5'-phosphate oxidase superfamily)